MRKNKNIEIPEGLNVGEMAVDVNNKSIYTLNHDGQMVRVTTGGQSP